MSDSRLLLALVALTSGAAVLAGRRWLALEARELGSALARVLEWVGLSVLFHAANVAAGCLVVVAMRTLGGRFVSVYVLTDPSLLVLSALQATVLQWWRAASPRS